MATKASEARSTTAKARAEANFKKEERAKDGAKAMMEYQTNGRVVREKMARLKALRLAKEAADKSEPWRAVAKAAKPRQIQAPSPRWPATAKRRKGDAAVE